LPFAYQPMTAKLAPKKGADFAMIKCADIGVSA